MQLSSEQFATDVQGQLQSSLGNMQSAGERYSYPLVATYANQFVGLRFALIGDAAVGMHPVTAHGFNLGLKGQNTLAREIKSALKAGGDIGVNAVLGVYESEHQRASRPLYLATNAIVKLYTDDRILPKLLRKAVLRLGNHITPAKHAIMHQLTEVRNAA